MGSICFCNRCKILKGENEYHGFCKKEPIENREYIEIFKKENTNYNKKNDKYYSKINKNNDTFENY